MKGIHRQPSSSRAASKFAVLPDITDSHVHVVLDPYAELPPSVCGLRIVPDIYLPGQVLLCRRCLAALPDNSVLRPGASERRLFGRPSPSGGTALGRWWRSRCYDSLIRRALAAEERRHG